MTEITEVENYWDAHPSGSQWDISTDLVVRRTGQPEILPFMSPWLWKGKRVLELGCGTGIDAIDFARYGAYVDAVDLSNKALDVAGNRAHQSHLASRMRFHQGNLEDLTRYVKPRPFDLIYSFGVLHHTPRPERVLELLDYYYVERGTVLKIMLYHKYSWRVLSALVRHSRFMWWRVGKALQEHAEHQPGCPIVRTYSKRQAKKLIECRPRFKVIDIKARRFPLLPALEGLFGWYLLIDVRVT